MIMYGRGTASVAETIHATTEEAQEIIDNFFKAYPKIKLFVENETKKAKINGYTTTAWGRRRYLKHITDDDYSYKYNDNRAVDFNPLLTITTSVNEEVPQNVKDAYNTQLSKARSYVQKNRIIENAAKDGIDIIDNRKFIADASRQVVNSIIQGSAADMSKRAMILLGTNKELKELGFRMLFPVHDIFM